MLVGWAAVAGLRGTAGELSDVRQSVVVAEGQREERREKGEGRAERGERRAGKRGERGGGKRYNQEYTC